MIHYVRVAVALSRPPKIDEWRRYCVVAATKQEAELIAQQMAACTSVMPVESVWESSHRAGPVEPYGVMGCRCWHVTWDEDLQCFTDPEVWEVAASCPHHSEDTAAWAALDAGQNGKSAIMTTEDLSAMITSREPVECPPSTHSMFDFCPGDCGDDFESGTPRNPPTPETANAKGPDTDDTPPNPSAHLTCGLRVCAPGCNGEHRMKYATGAIVPDELKRRVDTVKVSSDCNCEQIDITVYADGPHQQYTRGRAADDCPLHGALAQIRAFGHIDVGDRLRVNDFGIWSITRYDDMAMTIKPTPKLLSRGSVTCTHCDDWSHSVADDGPGVADAYTALVAHWAATTADGTPECPRSPSQRRPSLWERMFRATMRLLPPVR